mgnify:CR=1 FL=1
MADGSSSFPQTSLPLRKPDTLTTGSAGCTSARTDGRNVPARLLNAWVETKATKAYSPDADRAGQTFGSSKMGAEASSHQLVSRLCLELTAPPRDVDIRPLAYLPDGDYALTVALDGTELVMAEDDILIADGLVRRVAVRKSVPGKSELQVTFEHPVIPHRDDIAGLPYTIRFTFSRDRLRQVFQGKRIGVDPGHGGKDIGFKGSVSLLEKDTSLMVARELVDMLKDSEAIPILVREEDIFLSDAARSMALQDGKAELCVQIHASGLDDPLGQRYRILIKEACGDSDVLGRLVSDAFLERMGIHLEVSESLQAWEAGPCPTVRVEPLCITYFSDEANFRAPLFRKRTAQAIFNGIHRFLRQKQKEATTYDNSAGQRNYGKRSVRPKEWVSNYREHGASRPRA